ncbi:hypothetical protein BFP97_00630 [Roseivirga sp. 4D4]|nr:hypothetical protein BFP97_00630 [Roseivirga sp. 4D4]
MLTKPACGRQGVSQIKVGDSFGRTLLAAGKLPQNDEKNGKRRSTRRFRIKSGMTSFFTLRNEGTYIQGLVPSLHSG